VPRLIEGGSAAGRLSWVGPGSARQRRVGVSLKVVPDEWIAALVSSKVVRVSRIPSLLVVLCERPARRSPVAGPQLGAQYNEMLADRTSLLLQLQGFAACGDREVRDAVRDSFGRMWQTVAKTTGLDPVTIKAFLAFGMLLNNGAALQVAELGEPWAKGVRTRIRPGLFDHITTETNR
jgi:hypothetical protein